MSKLDEINGRVKQGGTNPATTREVKPKKRESKDSTAKRPLWKSDWRK